MIRLDTISKQNGTRLIFIEASAALQKGEKIGLVGPNGAGKTTLFRMITGQEEPDEGQVLVDRGVSIGFFSQDVGEMAGRSAVAEVMDGAGPVSEVAAELASWKPRWPIRTRPTSSMRSSNASATCSPVSRSWAAMRWRGGPGRC